MRAQRMSHRLTTVGRLRPTGALVTILAISIALTACAPAGTRSGGAGGLTHVVMAEWYADHSPPPAVKVFVQRVFELSQGSLPIMLEAIPDGTLTEPEILRHVAAGRADFGFIGTRALDQVGIRAFEPLTLPFLMDSYADQAAVVSDPEVTRALSLLDQVGVTGLALLADEFSLPVGVTRPMRTPDDFSGMRFRTDESGVQLQSLRALGAHPTTTHLLIEAYPDYSGYDTTLRSFVERHHDDFHRTLTINTPLWPQITVLFINPASLGRLTAQQRLWVMTAAAEASAWSVAHAHDDVAAELADVCARGGLITTATTDQQSALRAQVWPVYRRVEADAEVQPMLAHVRALVTAAGGQPESMRAGCGPGSTPAAPPDAPAAPVLSGPGRVGSFPQGTYRMVTLPTAGAAGVITWTMRDGRWSFLGQTGPLDSDCFGYYDDHDGLVTFETTKAQPFDICAPPTWTARWAADGQSLEWSQVSPADYAADFAATAWTKIG